KSVPPPPIQSGAPPRTIGELRSFTHTGPITALLVSGNRTKVVSVSDLKAFWVWDFATGKLLSPGTVKFPTPIDCMGIKADASELVTVSSDSFIRWELAQYRPLATLKWKGRFLSPDGACSLAFDEADGKAVVRLLDVNLGKETHSFGNVPDEP